MRFTRIFVAVLGVALSLVLISAQARGGAPTSNALTQTTITIQKGAFGDSDDTFLYQYDPDKSDVWGISTFRVGYSHPYERGAYYGLLRFDLSPIPSGAEITQARLQLYCDGWSGGDADVTMAAYVVLRNTNVRQANWNRARFDHPWGQPGCNQIGTDRLADPESLITVLGMGTWYELDLTNAVQTWVNGSLDNNGLLMRAESGSGFFAFTSCDGSYIARHPKLVVTYAVAGGTPTPSATAPARATPTPVRTASRSPTPTLTSPLASPTTTATHTESPSLTTTPASTGTTVVLQHGTNGYTGCGDTHIYQWTPNANFCQESRLKVGYKQQNATLLRFDLAPIPVDALVIDASLELYAAGWSGANMDIDAYVIKHSVEACEATWKQSQSGTLWGQPGCNDTTDRRALPEATVATSGVNRWYDFELTAIVQDWVSGSVPNHGLLLRGSSPLSNESFYFASSEDGTISLRPKLIVTYRRSGSPTSTPILSPTATATSSVTPVATPTPAYSPTPSQISLTLAHITDANIGFSWIESQRLPLVVSTASQEAQVIVDTGNCTEHGTAVECIEYVDLVTNSATIPWRAVMGTRDTPDTFVQYIGPLEWSWDVGGYRLIGINTEAINYTVLDQALTTDKPCIIFGHFPLDYLGPADQSALRQRFAAYDVPLYVAGHVRYNSLQTDPQSGTVLVTGSRTVRCHYRVITLRGFEVESVQFKQACQ